MSRKAFLLLILLILSACGENVQVNQTTDTGFEDEKSWEISYLESIQARVIYFDKLITEVEKNYIKYKNNEITRYEFKVSLNLYYSDLKYPLGSIKTPPQYEDNQRVKDLKAVKEKIIGTSGKLLLGVWGELSNSEIESLIKDLNTYSKEYESLFGYLVTNP